MYSELFIVEAENWHQVRGIFQFDIVLFNLWVRFTDFLFSVIEYILRDSGVAS